MPGWFEEMARGDKLVEAMRNNPRDWAIEDIQRACKAAGLACDTPKRGSHYKIGHAQLATILTVPYNRPIKPIYIRELIKMIDQMEDRE
jgi:predicted RNA binding protein YcfA (HicA-like mRNA interferase family)